jgi:hypothetical protein
MEEARLETRNVAAATVFTMSGSFGRPLAAFESAGQVVGTRGA